jgi:hypothetical protein
MTIKLKVDPEEAHTALAHYADMAAKVQAQIAALGAEDHAAHQAISKDVAAWHARGMFLLEYVLDAGSHAVDLRQCLTAPNIQDLFGQEGSKAMDVKALEARGTLDRVGLARGLAELRTAALDTIVATLKSVRAALAAVESAPAARRLRASSNKVFFSWQKTLPNATNRSLIETALTKAIESLGDVEVDETLDRDTVDVAGAPEIVSTILDKIDNAAVFVADVSIVTPQGFEKPCPNPNVLLELGYALRALGPSRVILVANEHFGTVDTLPFDLRNRRVLCYRAAPEETDRATPRKKLAAVFEEGIRQSLGAARAEAPQNEIRIKVSRGHWGTFTNTAGTKVLTATIENHSSMPLFIASVGFEFAPMDGLMQEKDATGKTNSAAKVEPGDSYQWLTDLLGLLEIEDEAERKLWSFTVHTRIGHVLRSSPGDLQRVLAEARAAR